MPQYLTVVYTINDEDAFMPTLRGIVESMENSDGKPFALTDASCDHELQRLEWIREAIDSGNSHIIETIVNFDGVGDVKSLDDFEE